MAYAIQFSSEALADLKRLSKRHRVAIMKQIQRVLAINPESESRARVKRLEKPSPTDFRMRVGDFRVYYDVEGLEVRIIRIMPKPDSERYSREDSHGDSEGRS
jgi:mRNA interferase RelE/StbE